MMASLEEQLEEELQQKEAFFKQLKPLYSDDEFDAEEQHERLRCRRFFAPKSKPKPQPTPKPQAKEPLVLDLTNDESQHSRVTPRRVNSIPTPAPAQGAKIIKGTPMTAMGQKSRLGTLLNQRSAGVILVDDTPIPDSTRQTQRSLPRSGSTPLFASGRSLGQVVGESPSPSLAMKKRKRESSLKLRPESEQIFKDLTFYYVPDDDIAPARRLRITKAREFGATWVRAPRIATHIVVEKHIKFEDLEGVLKRTNKNVPPIVVNEEYPIDCIQFKALLQCNQKKYQLIGQPVTTENEFSVIPRSPLESAQSLQLKPPQRNSQRWDHVPLQGTPERSEESPHRSQIAETPAPTDSQPVILNLQDMVSSDPANNGDSATHSRNTSKSALQDAGGAQQLHKEDNHNDELSEYIKIMAEYKDLPLDADDEDAQTVIDMRDMEPEEQSLSGSEDEGAKTHKSRRKTRSGRKGITFEDRFACNSAGVKNAKAGNPNACTIDVLQKMADYYNRINDHWRTTAYRRAISTLKRQETKITSAEEAQRLPSVGARLAQKIEEIVTTDRLQRLEYAEKEPMDEALQLFLGIYGVGNSQAQQWLAQGFRTLEDLKAKAKLSPNQLLGIEHYEDLNTRIPRREVEALGNVVKRGAQHIDPEVELIIGGSYRRGAETSGDIDFIITKSNTESSTELRPFLDSLVQRLEAEGFLVARLASCRSAGDGSKWHGCCVLPKISGFNDDNYQPVWRRIDFLLVPESERGAALLYFTGNDIFNRSMRLLASKKGMRLNQRGLYKDVMRGPQRVKITEGELIEGRDERRIFDILGVKWREPHERWC
jgi:DNA polymerase IV